MTAHRHTIIVRCQDLETEQKRAGAIPEQIRLRHQITEHSLCVRQSLEGARALARQTSPAPFDGPKEAELYSLHAYLAHGIRAVTHTLFAALQATVIFEIEAHLVTMIGWEQRSDFGSGFPGKKPRLEEYVVK